MSKDRLCDKCRGKIPKDQIYYRLVKVNIPTKGKYGDVRKTNGAGDICIICYDVLISGDDEK